nr:uncharacterized protein LOC109190477 [Ipomoea batatas]
MDSDEWGIMTLREKVVELGFNKDDNLRFFTLGEKGLFEFMIDLETWNLVNNVVRPKVVEIWAILGVKEGESANEFEEFEGNEYENDKGDGQEVFKHVDPQVEYGGVQVPTNVEAEMHGEGDVMAEQVVVEQVVVEQVVVEQVVAEQVVAE